MNLTAELRPAVTTTPYLVVDDAVLQRNIDHGAVLARRLGVGLRPHVKTHKSALIARRQLVSGAVGVTVATIGEAEVFAAAGCADIFLAYPLWVEAERAARLRAVAEIARVRIGVDSAAGASQAGRQLAGSGIEAVIELDCGHHRSGAGPAEVAAVVTALVDAGLGVAGVFTFPGHSYTPDGRWEAARQEAHALRAAAATLRGLGLDPVVVSGGSTPSVEFSDTGALSEIRPGVYVLGDAQQWELGTCAPEQIALTAHATVVSHAGGRLVLDAGSKVLGGDRAAYASGHGRLLDHPDARIVLLSEHHAVVDFAGQPLPPLGSLVRAVPNHVCVAMNLVDTFRLVTDGVVQIVPVDARGRNG